MNIFRWLLKFELNDNDELDLQFGMMVVCGWIILLSFSLSLYFLLISVYVLMYLMLAIFVTSWGAFLLCRRKTWRAYRITYLYFLIISVLTHLFITYYLGDCGTVFWVVATLMTPHMYLILKQHQTFILDVFLLGLISFIFWFSAGHIPPYYDKVGSIFRLILTNVGIFTCLIELYLNMSSQHYLSAIKRRLIDRVASAAVLDVLTGLGNRRMLEQHRAEIEKACLERFPIGVAILDIDFFKRINDAHGHIVGDQVLEFIANTMSDFFRTSDLLIRWGGEEFLVILRDTEFADAAALMEKFRAKIQNTPLNIGGKEINVQVTIGLTELNTAITLDDSIKQADDLMYQGKLQGRNRLMWSRVVTEAATE